jgi:short-subunit dehydrogenase
MNVVITGASRGMGKAMAAKFAAEGHNLFLCAKNKKRLSDCVNELKTTYIKSSILFYSADLSNKTQVQEFGKWILQQNSSIDILINNAGNFLPGSIYTEEDGVLEEMININLYSAYHLTRTLLPKMMAQKQGYIFNICSIAALKAYPNGGSYSISKHALMGFSKNLREEMKPYNIKVTCVYPGAVYTSSWQESGVDKARVMDVDDISEIIYTISKLSPQACVEEIVMRPQLGDL